MCCGDAPRKSVIQSEMRVGSKRQLNLKQERSHSLRGSADPSRNTTTLHARARCHAKFWTRPTPQPDSRHGCFLLRRPGLVAEAARNFLLRRSWAFLFATQAGRVSRTPHARAQF